MNDPVPGKQSPLPWQVFRVRDITTTPLSPEHSTVQNGTVDGKPVQFSLTKQTLDENDGAGTMSEIDRGPREPRVLQDDNPPRFTTYGGFASSCPRHVRFLSNFETKRMYRESSNLGSAPLNGLETHGGGEFGQRWYIIARRTHVDLIESWDFQPTRAHGTPLLGWTTVI